MMTGNVIKGFTIIELLIVLGIVMILSGIALENYAGASVRAKVTRVKADHRTLQFGIEAYRVDHNVLPRMASSMYRDPDFDFIRGIPVSGIMSRVLSTPVAYISSAYLMDPFMEGKTSAPLDERLYTYHAIPVYIDRNPESTFWPAAREYYGDWRLGSVGPDQVFDHKFLNSAQLPYDPTNGLISLGNIWTAQRGERTEAPEVPTILGEH